MANDNRPLITDANALAHIVRSVGGNPVAGPTFRFDLPLSEAREAIPKINDSTGLGVRRISERQEEHPTQIGHSQSVITCELFRRGQE